MATLAEIRAQYPQYSDMTDTALADALYKKFYSDLPRADFDQKIGLKAPAQPQVAPGQIPGAGPYVAPPKQDTGIPIGRRVLQVVRPSVEALGGAGGALLGTSLGPAGAIGGAGLGYGAAKTGLDVLEQALGYQRAPSSAGEALATGAKDVLTGATMETGGRVVAPVISKVVGATVQKGVDLLRSPTEKAGDIARKALGADLPAVMQQLKAAGPNASVAEVTASLDNPTWQALINRSLERDPQFLRKLNALSENDSLNALAQLAGGATAADVRAGEEATKRAINALTGPQREAALTRANLGKAVADYEAQAGKLSADAAAKVQEVRRLIDLGDHAAAAARLQEIKAGIPAGSRVAPARGQPGYSDTWAATFTYPGKLAQMSDQWASQAANASLDLGQGARFAKAAADSLRSVGIKPLESEPLIRSLQAVGRNPEFAGNDLIEGSLKNISQDIAKWTGSGGVVDARALDAIRKNSVNAAIQQLRPGVDATTQRNLAAGVLSKVRPAIDDAIEAAGGAGYKDYLAAHARGMQRLAEQKLTGEALQLWKTNRDEFVRLVQNESPDAVEKILGPGKYNIATELADNTMSVLRQQADKRLTQLSVSKQVSEGQAALGELIKQEAPKFKLPSFLSFWATAGNTALGQLENAVGRRTMDALTNAMKTPEGAANLLQTLTPRERSNLLSLLQNPSLWSGAAKPSAATTGTQFIRSGVEAGIANALAPSSQNQNALAQ